jgi:hypothetical protein
MTPAEHTRLVAARGNLSIMVRQRDTVALQSLVMAGWVEIDGPVYRLTIAGAQVASSLARPEANIAAARRPPGNP